MNAFYPIVAERAKRRCEYCRAPESVFNFDFEVDHIIPRSRGGTSDLDNLALACRACNAFKSTALYGFAESGSARLFNPRSDIWDEHFRFNLETLEIESLSKIGGATVNRLKLNNSSQIRARNLWREINRFP